MGVESDQLVYDYLSRVGDLAQTTLPAAQRMRLVAQLRSDIDRERSGGTGDGESPAVVRRILGRLGSPNEVVEAAASRPQVPVEPGPSFRKIPQQREDAPGRGEPDWWRVSAPAGPGDELAGLPGMTGGTHFDFDEDEEEDEEEPEALEEAAEDEAEVYETEPRRRWLPRRRGRSVRERRTGPLLLLAGILLVAGAVIGSWIPLGLGWLLAYFSRQLSRNQAKFAVFGIPGMVAGGLLVWLWGRTAGRWGEPVAQGTMGQALVDALPVVVRVAAVGSALYLFWRSRRV
ncbi:hypothetical protein QMK19_33760 [Streptomyces sp. H10-C2]|uniref:hypothetical protein n=1 Tax=unclassified Streptomyces TaxID=2593676 RepID=UPI0024B9629B|nr:MULTISPECIES: hypothetical protein [unclassified Streptomyces]MDJ0345183.1 hypothetical protein [Streptomyces sp. PH10-H1]MDJ0374460.1 hypothetical protein [Streptomyces sp. H10-C2]